MLIIWLHTRTNTTPMQVSRQNLLFAGCTLQRKFSLIWAAGKVQVPTSTLVVGFLERAAPQEHWCITLTSKKGGLAFDGFVLVSKADPPKTNHLCYRNVVFHELFRWKTADSQHIFATCHSWCGWNHEKEMHLLFWTFFFHLAKITLK